MKQTPLRRRIPLGRGKKRRQPSDELRERMEAFVWNASGFKCAGCGTIDWIRAHHVIYKQHLPAELQWDTRNALPLCDDCHERHHNASRRIPLSALTESNLEFAREVLGEAADDYLRRRYAE